MLHYLLLALLVSLAINCTLFLFAYRLKTDKLTDASYALTFITLSVASFCLHQVSFSKLIYLLMITIWALRLGGFLLIRIWKTGTDRRFDDMRGKFWRLGKFWVLQALSVWIILLPALLLFFNSSVRLTAVSLVGTIIWLAGLGIEALADWQKYQFSNNPRNKGAWIETGIWKFSRHPNYLGEILVWIGVYLAVASSLSAGQLAVGILSPLFIMILLLFVSGIPLLEKSAQQRWGDNPRYQAYKKRTSILLLLPQKKS